MKSNPPKGYINLGLGGSFKVKGEFTARMKHDGDSNWDVLRPVVGDNATTEYAVTEKGWMAKLNGLCPNKPQKPSGRVAKKIVPPSYKRKAEAASGALDPKGIPQHEPGAKMDAGKDMAGLMWGFSRALEAVVKVGTYGAKKYTREGWNHVPDAIQRYQDAADRHTLAMGRGEELDPESGMPHEWHAVWGRLAVLELKLRQQKP